jgi:hypothetical protein
MASRRRRTPTKEDDSKPKERKHHLAMNNVEVWEEAVKLWKAGKCKTVNEGKVMVHNGEF